MKKLAIIKIDAIGDYVLFRNFLKDIRQSEKYRGWHITLLGNLLWKELAESLDSQYIDHFVWLDVDRFSNSSWYRRLFLSKTSFSRFDTVLCPTFSRRFYFEDDIVLRIKSRIKIGFQGDSSNIRPDQKRKSDSYYHQLVATKSSFEFFKNKEFIEDILGKKNQQSAPHIEAKEASSPRAKRLILFPGASMDKKRWSAANFGLLTKELLGKYNVEIVLCGSSSEYYLAEEIMQGVNRKEVVNLMGKTSLVEFIHLVASSVLVVTNDTVAVHIAASVGTKVICLYKGDHYGRFQPYPQDIAANIHTLMPDNVDISLLSPSSESPYKMDEIPVANVVEAVETLWIP